MMAKSALPTSHTFAVGRLAQMTEITLDRPTCSSLAAWLLAKKVFEDPNYGIRDLIMIILADHIVTLS
jgi:hypothetical protein